jgi:hypothetical protein
MKKPRIEVKAVDDKWGLFVNGELIGTSKHRYDADFAARVLTKSLEGDSDGDDADEQDKQK